MSNKSINKGLQTLVGGALSPTSSVTGSISTINFNKYYTKDEIDKLFEDLEISRNGDMHKEVYDTNNDGKVNNADLADEATVAGKLKTPVTIAGVEFDGSANIELTKENIGLGNVDNTSDLNKPISIATQEALDTIKGNAQVGVDLGSVDAKANANANQISILEGKMTTAEGKINELETLSASQNGKITTLENKVQANTSAIEDVKEKMLVNEGAITTIESTVSGYDARLTMVESKTETNESNITSLKNSVTAIEPKVSALESKIDVESVSSAIEEAVQNIDITNRLLPITTTHVKDRVGRLQEQINTTFYKGFGKEFVSNGEDIIVNNGIEGYVLNGKIEGQTVKNYCSEQFPMTLKILTTSSKGVTFKADGLLSNKQYDVIIKVSKNDTKEKKLYVNNASNNGFFKENYTIPLGEVGIFKTTLTTKEDISNVINMTGTVQKESVEGEIVVDYILIVDVGLQQYVNDYIPCGLSSTKAIINHNDVKYPIYATEEDKAQDKVIELNKVVDVFDTLEILEDGSGVYTQNTEEGLVDGTKGVALYGVNNEEMSTISFYAFAFDNLKSGYVVSDKLNYAPTGNTDVESICSYANKYVYMRVLKSRLSTLDVVGIKEWLRNNPVLVKYRLIKPIITYIPKELMPIIPTYDETIELPSSMLGVSTLEEIHNDNDFSMSTLEEPTEQMDSMFTQEPMVSPLSVISNPTGLFSFGENVKPSKVAITVPVVSSITELDTIVTQHSADITAIDKKVATNATNINSVKTTVNGYGTRITTVESKATTNASDIATIKDNITTLESEIATGLAKILEALV